MDFADKMKKLRKEKGWSQDDLAEKLFVSRQSVSKWEIGQNYPSIESIIRLSDLFDMTIDDLLRSDVALTEKVIQDSKQLAHPRLKFWFEVLFLFGVALMLIKLAVLLINNLTALDLPLIGGKLIWNLGSVLFMIGGAIGSNGVKEKYKED
ncbi:helix-turn-helix domain-containing protein [Sporolactobacillus terrae]|uniref:helix-turn-helix domain-containing protein n=1 Tax=Sporolactobacillus terrae TaxID=269673 RepID=UPI001119824C|nr:helix-turn-helix transcriptional regulator [Sporolactobacillus terrae]